MRVSTTGRNVTRVLLDAPSPGIQAGGIGGGNTSQYFLDTTSRNDRKTATTGKPPYRVPSMEEIRAIPWNGFKVASTFSGCGGSCTGYRMAGYCVVWANEFVPAAQDSYRANMESDCILDCRDIHVVQPQDILDTTRLAKGELDLFDGSPPCQAFSTVGKREKGWGQKKKYEHGASQCNETLFDEYIRLLRGLMPKVFVAENVSGLVKGTAKGFFLEILAALKASGYRVKCKLLDAQWLGVPQMRQRTIFVGVREDLGIDPVFPKPFQYRYSVQDALPEISDVSQNLFKSTEQRSAKNKPCPTVNTICAVGAAISSNYFVHTKDEKRKFTIAELKRICSFPDDFVLTGTYAQQWARCGNAVPPLMMYSIASEIRDKILNTKDN